MKSQHKGKKAKEKQRLHDVEKFGFKFKPNTIVQAKKKLKKRRLSSLSSGRAPKHYSI